MRVVVDTNVFISGIFWNGKSSKIIKLVESNLIELIISEEIIQEISKVLNYEDIKRKVKDKNLEMMYSLEKILSFSILVFPTEILTIITEDLSDNRILVCAVAGDVDCIISQDIHLLKLKEFRKIRIMTPEEFLKFNPPKYSI